MGKCIDMDAIRLKVNCYVDAFHSLNILWLSDEGLKVSSVMDIVANNLLFSGDSAHDFKYGLIADLNDSLCGRSVCGVHGIYVLDDEQIRMLKKFIYHHFGHFPHTADFLSREKSPSPEYQKLQKQ